MDREALERIAITIADQIGAEILLPILAQSAKVVDPAALGWDRYLGGLHLKTVPNGNGAEEINIIILLDYSDEYEIKITWKTAGGLFEFDERQRVSCFDLPGLIPAIFADPESLHRVPLV